MNIMTFTENFLQSEFAKKNLFMHIQIGIPMPFKYEDGAAVRYFLHKVTCTEDKIVFSQPIGEVVLTYPASRIIYFSLINHNSNYHVAEAVVKKNETEKFARLVDNIYNEFDKAINSDANYNNYYDLLRYSSKTMDVLEWYGGLYDSDSSI